MLNHDHRKDMEDEVKPLVKGRVKHDGEDELVGSRRNDAIGNY